MKDKSNNIPSDLENASKNLENLSQRRKLMLVGALLATVGCCLVMYGTANWAASQMSCVAISAPSDYYCYRLEYGVGSSNYTSVGASGHTTKNSLVFDSTLTGSPVLEVRFESSKTRKGLSVDLLGNDILDIGNLGPGKE